MASYGKFRIFIYPFRLEQPIYLHPDQAREEATSGSVKPLDRLYLIGLLPLSELAGQRGGLWNHILLVVGIIALHTSI